jgi:imidazolonepropionase-like amidohydrolase
MKRSLFFTFLMVSFFATRAQETMSPSPWQKDPVALTNAVIHVGNGQVIQNGTLLFVNGKITAVGTSVSTTGAKVIDCKGKQIYPGLINANTNLGLVEIQSVRSTLDDTELGDINPNIHSYIAYNADSKIINTVRSNGILLVNVIPSGGILSGTSSVMQLDAWNWEDALYKKDGGIYFNMPYLIRLNDTGDPVKTGMEKIDQVRTFLRQAKAYYEEPKHIHTNLKFEAVRGLFDKSQTFFVNCELVKEMMVAVELAKEFGFKTVIIGGTDSWRIIPLLKELHIGVILNQMHSIPVMEDDYVDDYSRTAFLLQQAGIDFCIADADPMSRFRNLSYNAGVSVAFGLTKEQALQSITLSAAKILGIADRTGSLEIGKDANIVVSDGDILDIKTSQVRYAFIQGRQIDLDNKQKQLYHKYMKKYGLDDNAGD